MKKKHAASGIRLEAMALEIPEFPEHPNRVPFSGVLTRLDAPSDRAPSGAAGHRVLLTRAAAERALPSLLGMAVDYAPGLRGHDVRRKIGIITRAEITGDRLEVAGHFFGKDFPEVLRELRAQRERLGMSYEVTGVRVADPKAAVWVLERVVFTGAAILERNAAAYESTSLAAASGGLPQLEFRFPQQRRLNFPQRGDTMDEKVIQTLDVLAQSVRAMATEVSALRASQDTVVRLLENNPHAQPAAADLETRVEELGRASEDLRRQNEALRAQAERFTAQATRKTLPPQLLTLLAKSHVAMDAIGPNGQVDVVVLDKALDGLPVEQRMAIKSQLARAGALL